MIFLKILLYCLQLIAWATSQKHRKPNDIRRPYIPSRSKNQPKVRKVIAVDDFEPCFGDCTSNVPVSRTTSRLKKDFIEDFFDSFKTFVSEEGFDSAKFLQDAESLNTSLVAFEEWLSQNYAPRSIQKQLEFVNALFDTMNKAADDMRLYNSTDTDHILMRNVINLDMRLLFLYPSRRNVQKKDILCAIRRSKIELALWTDMFNETPITSHDLQECFDSYCVHVHALICELDYDSRNRNSRDETDV